MSRRVKTVLILILAAAGYFMQEYPRNAAAGGAVKVVDGDSVFIGKREIRLSGIDAPEFKQECYDRNRRKYACGVKAWHYLQSLIDETLECRTVTTDRYKREVAVCFVNGEDINAKMVKAGWAVAYTRYTGAYADDEAEARKAKRGVWQGKFMQPELYRALKR